MEKILKRLKNVQSENCITIIMNSHRTKPDSLQDELALKNHIREVEKRLSADTFKGDANKLVDKLKNLAGQIDHNYNLESLLLFVNNDTEEIVKLPISVTDRIIIDNTFATRDLIRTMHIESNYYVLVLSQDYARLIEVLNDKVIQELKSPFPIKNEHYHSSSSAEAASGARMTNLLAEYFNTVDKEVNKTRNENRLKVLVCSVEENYAEYLKIADQRESIYNDFLNSNRMDQKADAIALEAWEIVKVLNEESNTNRKSEFNQAISEDKFLTDITEIWKAIKEGKIQTLFIEQDLFQSAIIENDEIVFVSESHRNDIEVIDDIYDELIELNGNYGGDVVFLPKEELIKYSGFAAITRY